MGQVSAASDRRARVREEQAERHDAHAYRQQGADPHPGAAERDKHATRGPGRQVDDMSKQVFRSRGQARPADPVLAGVWRKRQFRECLLLILVG